MKKLAFPFLLLLLCSPWHTSGQQPGGMKVTVQGGEHEQSRQPLTNKSITGLVEIGLSDETIVSMIEHEPGNYSLRVDDVAALKKARVSERVVTAMSSKMGIGQSPAPQVAAPEGPPPVATERLAPNGLGVAGGHASAEKPREEQTASAALTNKDVVDISNARIVQMTKLGLGDDIIIARIKTGNCTFALGDSDLAELKKAGVSDKVIAAMLEASVLVRPRVTIDGNPAELHTIGQEKVGGRLGHDVSLHIKSVKDKAYLQGQHASLFAKSEPAIQIELSPNSAIDDYILVRMDGKGDRRELEMASGGGTVGHKTGIRSDRIERTSYEPLGGRLYKLGTEKPLKHGEYILYIIGSADYEKGIFGRGYDFTVE